MKLKGIGVFLWMISLSISLKAQGLFIGSNQEVWIGNEAILSVEGHLESSGEIENQGEISVNGNWINLGQYIPSTGLIILDGEESQQFNHSGQTINQLELAGGGDKMLVSDINIASILNLNKGILRAENDALVYLGEDLAIEGGSDSSFVEGVVVNTGTGYKQFPVGIGNQFHQISLLDVQGNSPLISGSVIEPHPAPIELIRLESVSSTRYWQFNVLSGVYDESVIRVELSDDPDFSSLTGLVVAAAPQVASTYENLGVAEVVGSFDDGSITSELPTNLNVIALGLSAEFSERGEVLVPNAFAPDSPLEEDRTLSIFAVNLQQENFVFRIFNRWGKLVYETSSLDEALNNGWDGMNQETNQPAQFGVYSYYLSGVFSNNETVTKKGTLTLFR